MAVFRICLVLFVFSVQSSLAFGAVKYVNLNRGTSGTGTSWNEAFITIQEGINAAVSGDQVWVAQGVYDEIRTDPSGALILKSGVAVYGGFRGNENNFSQRNFAARVTTIDGSVARGESAAYHVVIGVAAATIDGFTIIGGNANGGTTRDRTGGAFLYETAGTAVNIANCKFTSNVASAAGGAIGGINAGTITLDNCSLSGNTSLNGGAVGITQTPVTFTACIFDANSANSGGAVYASGTGALQFSTCIFTGNQSSGNGGAIESASPLTATNCHFLGNTASGNNGGAIVITSGTATIVNSNFYGNSANSSGGAAYTSVGGSAIKNCILWNNSPDEIGGNPTVTYSCVRGGYGIPSNQNTALDPMFADVATDDFRLKYGSPCLNTGTAAGAPAVDIRGVTRPQGAGYDMGIYEMQTNEWPVVNFDALPLTGNAPLVVQFNDLSTGPDPILSWYWDFGDQYFSKVQNPLHMYAVPGTFSITLTATSILGAVSSSRINYIVVQPGTGGMLPDFTATPTREAAPFIVEFTDITVPGTATILEWYWDFGDGQNSYAQNPTHQYDVEGKYTVSLTLMTTQGNVSVTKTDYIDAVGALSASSRPGLALLAGLLTITFITWNFRRMKKAGAKSR